LSSGIKLVLFFITISALLGFTQVPIAEGEISWNGFLREIGFNPPSVYEVSGVSVIPGSNSPDEFGNEVQLRCLDGDWLYDVVLPFSMTAEPLALIEAGGFVINAANNDIRESDPNVISFTKFIGYDVTPKRNQLQQPNELFDITVVVSILCLSPSTFQTVGGEWQATDTTALIIGYSVLNMYWIAPIGIGIGVGIYLVKRRF